MLAVIVSFMLSAWRMIVHSVTWYFLGREHTRQHFCPKPSGPIKCPIPQQFVHFPCKMNGRNAEIFTSTGATLVHPSPKHASGREDASHLDAHIPSAEVMHCTSLADSSCRSSGCSHKTQEEGVSKGYFSLFHTLKS